MTPQASSSEAERFWEDFYIQHEHRWSGKANVVLVDVVGP